MSLRINMPTSDATVAHISTPDAAVKASIAGGGAVASYLTLNEWVAIATLVFVVLQIGLLIPKYWSLYKALVDRRNKKVKK